MKLPRLLGARMLGILTLCCCAKDSGTDIATTHLGSNGSNSETSADGVSTTSDVTVTGSTSTSTSTLDPTTAGCDVQGCVDMQSVADECDQWAQNCPRGQKCAAYILGDAGYWNSTKCVDVTGMDKPGDACTSEGAESGVDSCIAGAMCWNVDQEGLGICFALCTGTPDAPVCDALGTCFDTGATNLCHPFCNPILQDCPQPAQSCYFSDVDYFVCDSGFLGDEGKNNEPCSNSFSCNPGLLCQKATTVGVGCTDGSPRCCTPFCEFPNGSCPNLDQKCLQFFDPLNLPAPDLANIGVCGVTA